MWGAQGRRPPGLGAGHAVEWEELEISRTLWTLTPKCPAFLELGLPAGASTQREEPSPLPEAGKLQSLASTSGLLSALTAQSPNTSWANFGPARSPVGSRGLFLHVSPWTASIALLFPKEKTKLVLSSLLEGVIAVGSPSYPSTLTSARRPVCTPGIFRDVQQGALTH